MQHSDGIANLGIGRRGRPAQSPLAALGGVPGVVASPTALAQLLPNHDRRHGNTAFDQCSAAEPENDQPSQDRTGGEAEEDAQAVDPPRLILGKVQPGNGEQYGPKRCEGEQESAQALACDPCIAQRPLMQLRFDHSRPVSQAPPGCSYNTSRPSESSFGAAGLRLGVAERRSRYWFRGREAAKPAAEATPRALSAGQPAGKALHAAQR